jgi:hypothetical protein
MPGPDLSPALNVWRYTIATGVIENGRGQSFTGYAGKGMWMNDPESIGERSLGPLPTGTYAIGRPRLHPRLGPLAMMLDPIPGTDMLGRSGFYIHGDNARMDHSASAGCIILNRMARSVIASGLDHRRFLVVIPR